MNIIFRLIIHAHNALYRATGGEKFNMGGSLLLLNTIGAKSGKPRTNPLVFATQGGSYIIAATAAGADISPAWYFNLKENPNVSIEIKGKRIPVHARLVTEGEELEQLYAKLEAINDGFSQYQEKTTRTIPVVVLSPSA